MLFLLISLYIFHLSTLTMYTHIFSNNSMFCINLLLVYGYTFFRKNSTSKLTNQFDWFLHMILTVMVRTYMNWAVTWIWYPTRNRLVVSSRPCTHLGKTQSTLPLPYILNINVSETGYVVCVPIRKHVCNVNYNDAIFVSERQKCNDIF